MRNPNASFAVSTLWRRGVAPRRLKRVGPELILSLLLLLVLAVAHAQNGSTAGPLALDSLACMVAAMSGRWPRVASVGMVGVLVGYLLVPAGWATIGELAMLIPVFSLGLREQERLRKFVTPTLFGLAIARTLSDPSTGTAAGLYIVFWAVSLGVAWFLGDLFASARRAQQRAGLAALATQRAELARDLHDTVSHSLTLLSWRAQQARLHGSATTEDLDFFASTADQCAQDLRFVLSLLRSDQSRTTGWRLVRLDEIAQRSVTQLREAGFDPHVSVEGDTASVPAATCQVLDKIAIEAANNIVRHAPTGCRCSILVSVDDEVDMAFLNPMPGGPRSGRSTDAGAGRQPLGVTGMRERVTSAGGVLTCGPVGDQWLTRVSLPLGRPAPVIDGFLTP